jgi:hypothetical protein
MVHSEKQENTFRTDVYHDEGARIFLKDAGLIAHKNAI